MNKIAKMSCALLLAAPVAANAAHIAPDAPAVIADARLTLSDFGFFLGDGDTGGTTVAGLANTVIQTSNGQAVAALNGNADIAIGSNLAAPAGFTATVGTGFVAGTDLNGTTLNGTYAGAFSTGVSLLGPITTQAQLSFDNNGGQLGSASAQQSLNATATSTADQIISIQFSAEGFLRAAQTLDAATAEASIQWSLTVSDTDTGSVLVNWVPNSAPQCSVGMNPTCTVIDAPFSMNQSLSTTAEGNDFANNVPGQAFELEFAATQGQNLRVQIDHSATVSASRAVPEPGAIALLGAGLAGVGVARRRKA